MRTIFWYPFMCNLITKPANKTIKRNKYYVKGGRKKIAWVNSRKIPMEHTYKTLQFHQGCIWWKMLPGWNRWTLIKNALIFAKKCSFMIAHPVSHTIILYQLKHIRYIANFLIMLWRIIRHFCPGFRYVPPSRFDTFYIDKKLTCSGACNKPPIRTICLGNQEKNKNCCYQ